MDIHITLSTVGESAERNAQVLRAIAEALHPTPFMVLGTVEDPSAPPAAGVQISPEDADGNFLEPVASTAAAEASDSAPEAKPVIVPTPPAAESAVPKPPAAVATQDHANVARDANGLPWDERIHAGSRALVADGTWRMKRGVHSDVVAGVTAQLKAEALVAGVESEVRTAVVVSVPTPPSDGLTFQQVMKRVMDGMTSGQVVPSEVVPKLKELGVENLPALDARPDLWEAALTKLGV